MQYTPAVQKIEREINRFISSPPEKFFLWGAGVCGLHCYSWLQNYGLSGRVAAFIDSDKDLQARTIFNIPVHPPKILDKTSDVPVVICTQSFRDVYGYMQKADLCNPAYVFEDRSPFISGTSNLRTPEEAAPFYAGDERTQNELSLLALLRSMHDGGIVPYLLVENLTPYFDYWDAPGLSLQHFPAITYIDGGAYTGDSIVPMVRKYPGLLKQVHAFEPDKNNFSALTETIEKAGIANICHLYNAGLADRSWAYYLDDQKSADNAALANSGSIQAKTVTIDSLAIRPQGKLCIKLDIEGFEISALDGMRDTISKHCPELAICVYHKYDDIYDIPAYIKSLVPEYSCILRCGAHMECYASIERF
ncbi:MAG: FkbM family methyltransferase [Christensenellaceae bacterium]|jgi:FkbM family methyltransferase